MSYIYLLDLHRLIDRRIAEAEQMKQDAEKDSEMKKFHEGRIDILSDVKAFLIQNLNPKLPRALRKSENLKSVDFKKGHSL